MSFSAPEFELRDEVVDARTLIIHVSGEVHVSTAPEFAERLESALVAGHTHVVLDLSDVVFMDSTGLGVLVSALRSVGVVEGRLLLVCSNPTILRLFSITGLQTTFEIVESLALALEMMGADQTGAAGSSAGAP